MRLFLALDLPDEARAEMRRRLGRLRSELPEAKWVSPEVCHLTLVFYGETGEGKVGPLSDVLRTVFSRHPPFTMRLQGAGTFPAGRPARVAWIGVKAPTTLMALHRDAFESSAGLAGLETPQRPFHPHVTLARCRRPWPRRKIDHFVQEAHGSWSEPFRVAEGVLFQSHLGPRGPRHEAVARFPLEGQAA
jgi:2'-5' RNA ligase